MHDYGTTTEQLAEIAVSARFNAADNPEAAYREPITADDVLSGPVIADPFTKLHCCIRSDGGAAVVLVAEDRVPDLLRPGSQRGGTTTWSSLAGPRSRSNWTAMSPQ